MVTVPRSSRQHDAGGHCILKRLPSDSRSGQAVIVMVACLSIFMIGALGLAIDGAQMYAQRQMAQTAADAAAQAGILSIFDGTNSGGGAAFTTGSSFNCSTTDARTPCV